MSRLPRPLIPTHVKLTVALRQLGSLDKTAIVLRVREATRLRQLGAALSYAKEELARKFGCEVADLRLDHNPAIENREKLVELPNGRRVRTVIVPKGAEVIRYFPDANDPEHLLYRPHSPEFALSHLIKTNVSGDGAKHSDRAMAAKNKNIARNRDPRRRKAKIHSANRWPPRGTRKIQGRKKR